MNGCVTKEGIAADLESFKKVGLAGTQNFLVGGSEAVLTDPSVEVLNPKWQDLMHFAITESAQLGLSFGTHNCPGWSASGGPWVKVEESMQKLVWSESRVTGPGATSLALPRPAVDPRWNFYRDVAVLAFPARQKFGPENVLDLTSQMDTEGRLRWVAPVGEWIVLRLGSTTTGALNGTAPLSGQGLEIDKMSRTAFADFWSGYPAKIAAEAGVQAGATLARFEVDSYEAGAQNWTPKMRDEFTRLRGYDPLPWLPALLGRTVGDGDRTTRFLYDWQRTIEDLFKENYFGSLRDFTHRVPGMQFLLEPYATGHVEPFQSHDISETGDILMCEFWQKPAPWGWDSVKPVASDAHTWGKTLVAAEAFTGQPQYAWLADPYALKSTGDRAFCLGVNLFVLHASAHQPWTTAAPGMTMGWWGTQFGRGQTWWDHGAREWLTYVSRCQFLLQQGCFVGDLCYLTANRTTPAIPHGFDADTCGEQTLLKRATVRDGRLFIGDGPGYRLLVLPDSSTMTLALARRLRELVRDGAVVCGPKPQHCPSLENFPAADHEVAQIGEQLWGNSDGVTIREHSFGAGKIFCGLTPADVLVKLQAHEDVTIPTDAPLLWIHRRVDAAEIYFLSNQSDTATTTDVSFRVTGLLPELWHADTGEIEPAEEWTSHNGRTTVTLSFDPSGSIFVIFRQPTAAYNHHTKQPSVVAKTLAIDGPWQVFFPPGWGAPEQITLEPLTSWSTHPNRGVRYFSGTARYTKEIILPEDALQSDQRCIIDLGTVKNTASLRVNGRDLGCLWKPPFRMDITASLHTGRNQLEIEVTNLWPNRMIGDEQEPDDCEWGEVQTFAYVDPPVRVGRPLLHIPSWLTEHKRRPSSGRYTFSSFKFFTKDSPLLESGMLGPVRLINMRSGPIDSRGPSPSSN